MPSEQAIQFRDMLAQTTAVAQDAPTVEGLRETFAYFGGLASPLSDTTVVETVDAAGVSCEWIESPDAGDSVLVYFHGGGYIMGSAKTHTRVAGHLAQRIKSRALVVDYRLAPEHPHPAPVQDCARAYEWLLGNGVDPSRVVFAGESAGGALTISTQLLLRDRKVALPAASVPMSPWLNLSSFGPAAGDGTSSASPANFVRFFLGPDGDLADPLADPLHGDLTGLGPMYIQVGGDEEQFIDGCRQLQSQAQRLGIRVELDIVPDMQHMFELWAGNMPEADAALDRIGLFLTSILQT